VNVQVPTLHFSVLYNLIHDSESFFAKLKHPDNIVNFWVKRLILTKADAFILFGEKIASQKYRHNEVPLHPCAHEGQGERTLPTLRKGLYHRYFPCKSEIEQEVRKFKMGK